MSFNAAESQAALIWAITKLDPWNVATYASPDELEGRADYIHTLGKLVADHIEEMAANADASQSMTKIDETDAQAITDITSDLAGSIRNAAQKLLEVA